MLLFLSLSVSGATYYIDPSGLDSNNGSSSSPWRTLAYACSKVTTAGDIIHVNSGSYTETIQSILAAGVSIEGEGVTSVILSKLTSSYTISLSSGSQGTNGNQHISGILMDGNNLTAYSPIIINARSNVKIFNCTFQNFKVMGVVFNGGIQWIDTAPATWSSGNEFHDNIVNNCAGYIAADDNGYGCLGIGGQIGMLVYNNTITQNQRGTGLNGYCIKFYSYGYNKGLKIYNNTLVTAPCAGVQPKNSWGFTIEMWNILGGFEIYSNIIKGCVDLVKPSVGSYPFACDIHDNIIGFDTPSPALDSEGDVGIRIEYLCDKMNIYNNEFKNLSMGLYFSTSTGKTMRDVYVYYNIFRNIGTNINEKGWGIRVTVNDLTNIFDNWNIINNVFTANKNGGSTVYGIQIPGGNVSNITIRNNTIQGFSVSPIFKSNSPSKASTVSIENNLFFDNGSNNDPSGSATFTNYVLDKNLKANPLFVSSTDFHLQTGSPAIGKGLKISWITTDYDGNAINDPPSIGVYEFGSSPLSPGIPAYQSSVVENATPSILEMTYNLTLADIIPAVSAFSVLVNAKTRTVNKVAISGTKVQLMLASPIISGDVVTVSYTKPSGNPLQTATGGEAATISARAVTNKVISTTPVYVSSVIENATPSLLEMTYSLTLANIVPSASAFIVLVNAKARTINKVTVSGTKVQLTLASPVVYGEVVTVAYTKPTRNPLQTATGGQVATSSAQAVTNKVNAVIPVYVSSAIENATPSLLEITYSLTLVNIVVPSASAFTVLVNSQVRTISKVTVSGTRVQLTLTSPVVYGEVVTLSYTKPSSNPLQTASGGQAATISAQSVTNKVSLVNPVYVSSAIGNATPSLLEMTYSLALANKIPSASAFTVSVNSKAITVNKVAISGTKVQLTLVSPVVHGDFVTVAYRKPSSNPLQTVSGGQAATITAQNVTNNVDPVNPAYVSSSIEDATPSSLEMTYSLTLANIVPSSSSFIVLVNSNSRTINKVAVSGNKVQLTLASPVVSSDVVTVSYTKPSGSPLQTASGGMAVSIANQSVKNNCVNDAPEVEITSPLNDMSFTSSAIITITANASDADGSITMVEFFNGNTKLGSKSEAPYSFDWNNITAGIYSLTAVATDNQNLKTKSAAITISVTNDTDTANQPPVVVISNPAKGNKYETSSTVEIEVIATDPDGSISKVELYSGLTKLVVLTSAPYLYSMKNVNAGSYSIKAVAYDNLNATSTSSPIAFNVSEAPRYDANSEIINLYPNPNNGHFSIEFLKPLEDEKCSVVITDLGGKQVSNMPILEEETIKQFDLPYIKSGMYIMMIIGKGILVTKKFIKK
jgi:uncharacterized repeat protein (TIGR02059 family)